MTEDRNSDIEANKMMAFESQIKGAREGGETQR